MNIRTSAKMLLVGETGNGKSSLGNFILNRKVFSVSNDPKAETKITRGEHGINETQDIFVIDTPGLQDSEGSDKEHLIQMVEYIKSNPGLQGIIIVFNFHQPRLAMYIKTLIKLLCNVFPGGNFWSHVALVWTKFYYYLPEEVRKQSGTTVSKLMPEILELVRNTNGDNSINSFPTFFVDSDFEKKDQFSCEEINRLIAWVHQLQPIDVSKVKEADPNIKEVIEEEDIRETKSVEGNVEHIKKEYFKRNKEIHYDGSISYTNWEKTKEENNDNVLPKQLLEEKIDKKEVPKVTTSPIMEWRSGGRRYGIMGPRSRWQECVGHWQTTTIEYYERKIKIYNDGSVEEGEWVKVDTKSNTVRV
jgi:GTPase SAR1 family protein